MGSGERGRPESQDPGTCRTTGRGALGGSHSARRAPSAPTTAAATLSVSPEGAGSRRLLPGAEIPVRCRRRRCVVAAAARRRSSQRPPGPDPKACEPGSCALADRAPEVRL